MLAAGKRSFGAGIRPALFTEVLEVLAAGQCSCVPALYRPRCVMPFYALEAALSKVVRKDGRGQRSNSSAGDTAVLRIAGLTPWRAVAASAAITALVQLARQTEAAVRLEEALHSSTAWITAVH